MKYIKTFEDIERYRPWEDNYDTKDLQKQIQKYFLEKYPKRVNLLNYQGFINPITLDILYRFATKRKDLELVQLIDNFKDKLKDLEMERTAKKYNI